MKPVKSSAFVLHGWFRKDPSETLIEKDLSPQKTYLVEEKTVDYTEGEKRQLVEKEFPITQEYVDSFLDASDYRNNPSAYLSGRQNLGDIREVQRDFSNGADPVVVRQRITDLREQLAQLERVVADQQKQTEQGAAAQDTPKGDDVNGN